jgi:hypothetical protein
MAIALLVERIASMCQSKYFPDLQISLSHDMNAMWWQGWKIKDGSDEWSVPANILARASSLP